MEVSKGGGDNPQKEMNVNVDLSQATTVECTNCNSKFFQNAMMFKKVSKILTGADTDQYAPIQTFRCMDCGEVLDDFLPEEMKKNK